MPHTHKMACPKCGFDRSDEALECVRCGIVFAKYHPRAQDPSAIKNDSEQTDHLPVNDGDNLKALLFHVDPEVEAIHIIGRGIVLALLLIMGVKLVFSSIESNYAGESFMHNINLPFHEAGHVMFRILGRFMMALGGSLMQLLVPLVCMLTFLIKTRDPFAASVGLWWTGENLIDLAPYINDARALKLILIGGVTGQDVEDYHDWEYILRNLGLMKFDHSLAALSHFLGALIMIIALIYGGFMLFSQFRTINRNTFQDKKFD